jgi:tetratricopeptide (TPR) repeat protein
MRSVVAILVMLTPAVTTCLAVEVGDIVVPMESVELKVNNQVVAPAPAGYALQVFKVKDERLWVSNGRPGWIDAEDVMPLADAADYFSKAIAADATDAELYCARANVWTAKKEYAKAIQDYNSALKLTPGEAWLFSARALCHQEKGDLKRSIEDHSEAIRLQPDSAGFNNRGFSYMLLGEFGKSVDDLETAIKLEPTNMFPVANLGYIRACCPEAQYRDGVKAVALMRKACDADNHLDPENLHILACAYAERGDFARAVRWERKALELNPANKTNAQTTYAKALELFKQTKPFHEISTLE